MQMAAHLPFLSFFDKCSDRLQGKGGGSDCPAEVRAIARFLNTPAPTVFDVGANKGCWSDAALNQWPDAKVYLFEPAKVNLVFLNNRFRGAQVIGSAVSDRTGSRTLFSDHDGSGLASLHKRRLDHHHLTHEPIEQVSTVTLDDFCAERGIDHIDVLKLDIEGHELTAMKGAKRILKSTRVLQFEFGGCNIDSRTYFQDFWYLLTGLGFAIYRISPLGPIRLESYSEKNESFLTANYLAVAMG